MPERPRQDGSAAAEFALVAALLAVLVLGGLDLALAVTGHAAVAAAAREAARQAAVDGGDSPAVRQRAADVLALAGLEAGADVVVQPKRARYGRPIQIRVTVPYEARTPVLRQLAGGSLMLKGEAVTRNERVP